MLVDHMSKGLSIESFAGVISVNIDTLYEWVKVHHEFSEAKKIGTAKSLLKFEALGIANLQNKNFNNTIWIYQMKCRFNKFGWNPIGQDSSDAGDDFEFK